MPLHPIYRVRRRVLATIINGGGEPQPDQYRRAALEPFDEYVDPFGEPPGRPQQEPTTPTKRRPPGPAF